MKLASATDFKPGRLNPTLSKEAFVGPVYALKFRWVKEITGAPIRILVAEDHRVVSDGIVAILSKAKDIIIVGQASNGPETIQMLKRLRPDIVLLDLRMPSIDGIGVARWMKRSGSTARIIILTAFNSPADVHQAFQAGASAYLLKDVSVVEIVNTIRRVHQLKDGISDEYACEPAPRMNSADLEALELEILSQIVQGNTNRIIGTELSLGADAVKYRLRKLFRKLGVRKRAAAARQALERGLIEAR